MHSIAQLIDSIDSTINYPRHDFLNRSYITDNYFAI